MLQDTFSLKPRVICIPFLGNTPLWSLSYEWWFYMLFYFFTKQFSNKAFWWVYIISSIATASYIWYPCFLNRQLMYLIIPWVGVVMANLYIEKKLIGFKNLQIPLIFMCINTAILGINVLYMHGSISLGISPFLEFRHFSFAMLAIFFFIIWNRFQLIGFSKLFHFFIPVASISYGIYISHWFLVVKASYLNTLIENRNLRMGIYIIVCLLFAYFIERVVYVQVNKWIYHPNKKLKSLINK
jgi:peptidoglycan/LPS O-acetylase OafA/YrhL